MKIDFWKKGEVGTFLSDILMINLIFDQQLYSNRCGIFCYIGYILAGSFRKYVNKIYQNFVHCLNVWKNKVSGLIMKLMKEIIVKILI